MREKPSNRLISEVKERTAVLRYANALLGRHLSKKRGRCTENPEAVGTSGDEARSCPS